MLKLVVLCIFASVVSIESAISPGKCVNIPVIKDFNAARYLGNWYEIERFNYIFEDLLKCLVATYGQLNATAVSVHNEGVNIITGEINGVSGYAYVPDPSQPNKLTVNLPITFLNSTLFRNNADYQVVDTDYTNYALVYSCLQIPLVDYKDEFVWILGRSKTLDKKIIVQLKETLTKLGVDTKPLLLIDQNC